MENMSPWAKYSFLNPNTLFCLHHSILRRSFLKHSFFSQVEAALSISPYVENIMVHADSFYSYCVALVVASQHTVEGWASKQGIDFANFEELCTKEQAVKEVYASLVKVCSLLLITKLFESPSHFLITSVLCRRLNNHDWRSLRYQQRSNYWHLHGRQSQD